MQSQISHNSQVSAQHENLSRRPLAVRKSVPMSKISEPVSKVSELKRIISETMSNLSEAKSRKVSQ